MAVTGTPTAGADTLIGDNADDIIRGGKGNDRILGGGGRDTIWGDDGSDTLDGGSETDTAAYLGKASTYQITQQSGGSWTVKSTAKNSPTDLLTNVERLQFDDRLILLTPSAAPIAVADSAVMNEDGAAITIDVLANDSDADRDAISLSAIRSVTGGTASIVNGKIVFTAAANFSGTATITYAITESLGSLPVYNLAGSVITPSTAEGSVSITVNAVNDAPTAPATRSVSATEDVATAAIAIGAADIDGDALSYSTKSVAGQLTKGSVAYSNGGFVYTPTANANGSDSFTILIGDGKGGTTEQLVTVTIAAVNDSPTGLPAISGTAKIGQTLVASGASLTDADGLGALTFTWQVQDGAQWTSIGTGTTHTIGDNEIGKALRVVTSYTDGGGMQESVVSAPTAPIRSGLQILDSVIYAGEQYDGVAYGYGIQLHNVGAFGDVTYVLLSNPDVGGSQLVSWFDSSGYLSINVGDLPAGTSATATVFAMDASGDSVTGTVTLNSIAADLPGFSLAGGAGDDVFLLPSGGGTVATGGGSDIVAAAGTNGSVVVTDSDGESLIVQITSMTGDLTVNAGSGRVYLSIDGLDGALTMTGSAPISYGEVSNLTGGLTIDNVQSLYASYVTGDVMVTLAPGGNISVDHVAGNAWLMGEGFKSAANLDGFAFLSGNGTLVVENIAGTATLMGGDENDTLRASNVQGGAALDGGAGHDWYEGSGADAATGVHSFESFVLRAGDLLYDYIAGFDGVAGGSGDQVMLVGYGQGSLTLEYQATATLPGVEYYNPSTGYVYGPPVAYVSEKIWRIDGTEDRFRTLANTWQTSSQDPVTGTWTWTWHVDDQNFDPLNDVVWV